MAVTDILASSLDASPILEMSRGNGGVVGDIQARKSLMFELRLSVPVPSDVKTGVQYGQQGIELTGTLSAAGGGSGMSKSRVVNQ